MMRIWWLLSTFIVLCCGAPTQLPFDQITAIFPAEVYHLRVRTTQQQREFIVKTVDAHPDNEQQQWAVIRATEPRLTDTARALWTFLHEKEAQLSPPGRLLFNKLIDGVPIVRWYSINKEEDQAEVRKYVYETLRLWYSMDLPSKQNFAKILPHNAAALSNPNLVHYALGTEMKRSQ